MTTMKTSVDIVCMLDRHR